jgi:hypothetical protein
MRHNLSLTPAMKLMNRKRKRTYGDDPLRGVIDFLGEQQRAQLNAVASMSDGNIAAELNRRKRLGLK